MVMAKKVVKNTQGYILKFDKLKHLHEQNKIQLGILNGDALGVVNNREVGNYVNAKFNFYTWIAFIVLILCVYYSFTEAWWFIIIGLVATFAIWSAVKKANAQNIVNYGIANEDFYNKILELKGWIYLIDEDYLEEAFGNNSLANWIHNA